MLNFEEQVLNSPCFKTQIDQTDHIDWEMQLQYKSLEDPIELYLKRVSARKTFFTSCELSLLDPKGAVLKRKEFLPDEKVEFPIFKVRHSDKLDSRTEEYLPNDTLTIRCKIWHPKMPSGQFLGRTVLHWKEC